MAWCTRLALDLIDENFGSSVRAVADALVALGPSSLPEVARVLAASPGFLGSSAEQSIWTRVRACLITLICHDTIECSVSVEDDMGGFEGEGKSGGAGGGGGSGAASGGWGASGSGAGTSPTASAGTLRYEFRPVAALRLMRIPHFIASARRGFAGAGAAVAQALLLHGIFSRSAVLAEAARDLMRDEAEEEARGGGAGAEAAKNEAKTATAVAAEIAAITLGSGAGAGITTTTSTAATVSLSTFPKRRTLSTSSAQLEQQTTSRATERSAFGRVAGAWDAMVAASLIVPHAGLEGFPDFLLASSARGAAATATAAAAAEAKATTTTASGGGAGAAASRKRKAAAAAAADSDEDEDEDTSEGDAAGAEGTRELWRFGWEAASRRLRDTAIARFLASALSSKEDPHRIAGAIAEALLRLGEADAAAMTIRKGPAPAVMSSSRTSGAPLLYAALPLPPRAARVSAAKVMAELNANFPLPVGALEWSVEDVKAVVAALCAHPSGVFSREIGGTAPGVRVSVRAAVAALQLRTVEVWTAERFASPLAPRILRRILDHGLLEEKAISDLVLAEAKSVRMILFRLVAEGLLVVQEVPRRPDRNPQHTAYLFGAVSTNFLLLFIMT